MGEDDLICICMSVSRGEIKAAIRNGCTEFEALKSTLFCCTGCGTCEGRVRAILEQETQATAVAAPAEENKKAG